MKNLTIVCPAYNEEESIADFHRVLRAELNKLSEYKSTILFVVDGGTDRTFQILEGIAASDIQVSVLKLSRNFGQQMALLAGLDAATDADVIVSMDSDLQHPPSVIPLLLAEFEKGSEVVYTIREKNKDAGFFRKMVGAAFYFFINSISEVPINENASDFRLISKRVGEILRTDVRERTLFLRGVISWVGFKQTSVKFAADKRMAGKSKYSLSKLFQFGLFGIVSFSRKPLRAAALTGMCFAGLGALFAVFTVIQYFLGQIPPSGFSVLVVLISLFGGVQLMFLGIIGEYIGAIFDEVKARPHYLIEKRIR